MKELTKTQIAKINGGVMDLPAIDPSILKALKDAAEKQRIALSIRMRGIS